MSKNVRKLCFRLLTTVSGDFSDTFSTFFGHFVDILFFWAVQRFARYSLSNSELKGNLVSLYYLFRSQGFVESIRATCTLVRSIFGTSGSGQDSRNPP